MAASLVETTDGQVYATLAGAETSASSETKPGDYSPAYILACTELGRANTLYEAYAIVKGYNDKMLHSGQYKTDQDVASPLLAEGLKLEDCLKTLSDLQNSTVSLDTIQRSNLAPNMANAIKDLLDLSTQHGLLTRSFFTNPHLTATAIGKPLGITEIESGLRALRTAADEKKEQAKVFDNYLTAVADAMKLIPNEMRRELVNRMIFLIICMVLIGGGSLSIERVDDVTLAVFGGLSIVFATAVMSLLMESNQQSQFRRVAEDKNQRLSVAGHVLIKESKPVVND